MLAVTNVTGSQATREADGVLFTRAGLEIGVAATKTFICQVAIIYLLGLRLAELRGCSRAHGSPSLSATSSACPIHRSADEGRGSARAVAETYWQADFFLYIGRHVGLPGAGGRAEAEGDLLHCHRRVAAGEMKHGPIALLTEATPVQDIDSAFSIFYVGINLGAFFSPLVCGTLGEAYGYHWGYFAAGVGMVFGLLSYLVALRKLPHDRQMRVKAKTQEKKPFTGEDWQATIALCLLFIPGSLFWAAYEQQGNAISLFAQDLTDRRFIPGIINWEIPVTWFQAFNPGFIMLLTPLVVWYWARQSKRNAEPSVLTKMALGNFMMAISYIILMAAMHFTAPGSQVSWLWLLGFFGVITLGELYFSPIGLALTARVAPPQIVSMMMGVWLMTSFTGNLLQGYIGSYFTRMDKENFFLLCAGVSLVPAVAFWLFNFPLKKILAHRSQVTKPGAEI